MHFVALLLDQQPDPVMLQHMAMAMLAIFPIIFIVMIVIVILPFWFICKKAGFSPWLSLLNFVPLGSLILLYVLAFSEWKVAPVPQAYFPMQPVYPPQPPFPPQS